jgi:AAA15 family ATPase/GTPase
LAALDVNFRKFAVKSLIAADTGISGLKTRRSSSKLFGPAHFLNNDYQSSILLVQHEGEDDGDQYDLPMLFESHGTQMLLSRLAIIYKTLKNGSLCLIDEADSSLHFILFKNIIGSFLRRKKNGLFPQLLFNSHQVMIIKEKILTRD